MASRPRRAIPDNLDPLVDTLANVVGILVIVIVLTQIELGDALARVIELDARRARAEQAHEQTRPEVEAELREREARLARRTDVAAEDAAERAREVLAALEAIPAGRAREDAASRDRLSELRAALATAREASDDRAQYAEQIRQVPARMVARLPDPEIVRGREAWVLVRYGRVYVVDREKLFDAGSQGIARILADGENRSIRQDEFDAVALYLRKRPIGAGVFRWRLETEPEPRVELVWQTRDGGLDHTQLDSDPTWRGFLAALSPEADFVRFQVWSDSFETYLAARQSVEAAGLRAGWTGYRSDQELVRVLRFAPRPPPERPIEVD